ncbi:hypothetical protein H4Q26_007068 [Puccinia striiformis f. sp. tritici PST-130]|nr:hypothetical protein H4Q26_007068 [Puccinia striiformis f. sp. tritici PST-130]
MSITSLSQNPEPDQSQEEPSASSSTKKKTIKLNKTKHSKSRLVSARRRSGLKKLEEDESEEIDQLSSDHSTTSSLSDSDEEVDDDDKDEDEDDEDDDSDDDIEEDDRMKKKTIQNDNYDDQGQAFQVDNDDLESGVCNGHPIQSDPEANPTQTTDEQAQAELDSTSTFVPNKIAKIKSGQNPADEPSSSSPPPTAQTTALSTPASSADSSIRRLKPQQTSTAVSAQSHNTTIIFNQASWVTGLSAALAATTNNNNPTSTDDQPVQAPRYIPYIEFENYSTYGNLIFDLNTGLSRTARVDCKPDGLEKAPPEALEEQFVRISPTRDQQPSNSTHSSFINDRNRASTSHAQTTSDGNSKDDQDPDRTVNRANNLNEGQDNETSEHRLKIKITQPPIEASSTSTSSHFNLPHNRPPSSLAGGTINNRPSSSFSCAAQSEDNRSASASEAHSLEPWAVPRSGRFWGHDDRQSYQRRGGRGSLQNQAGSGTLRGTLRNGRIPCRLAATSPSSRKANLNGSSHRPETPASDTGRSVGSGAGWITVPSKQQKAFPPNGFQQQQQHHHNQPHSQHDGWEEIERKLIASLTQVIAAGWFQPNTWSNRMARRAPSSSQLRRPINSITATPSETQSINGKSADVWTSKSSTSASTSTPRVKEASQASARDGATKLVNGHHHSEVHSEVVVKKTKSPPIVENRHSIESAIVTVCTASSQPKPVLVQLPKSIKIGTIAVYPPVTLQSKEIDRLSTPDLSDTLQVSRSTSTLEDHPSQKSDPVLTPVTTSEPPSGPITLGSAGGAESINPRGMLTLNTAVILGFFGELSCFAPSSFGHHHHHHHNQQHPILWNNSPLIFVNHPPPHNFHPSHWVHLPITHKPYPSITTASTTTTTRTSAWNFTTTTKPPYHPYTTLQYFESHNNHNVVYPHHPPSFGPHQQQTTTNNQQQQQLGPSRATHPPIFHPLPPPPSFEPTPPPPSSTLSPQHVQQQQQQPVPPTSTSSSSGSLPGHFVPPKSTKVRISHPKGNTGATNGPDDSFYFASSSKKLSSSSTTPTPSSSITQKPSSTAIMTSAVDSLGGTGESPSGLMIKTTETGISYYEYNGVTYFGDSLPPHLIPLPPAPPVSVSESSSTATVADKVHSRPIDDHLHLHHHQHYDDHHLHQQQQMISLAAVLDHHHHHPHGSGSNHNNEFRRVADEFPIFTPPPPPPLLSHHPHQLHHHHHHQLPPSHPLNQHHQQQQLSNHPLHLSNHQHLQSSHHHLNQHLNHQGHPSHHLNHQMFGFHPPPLPSTSSSTIRHDEFIPIPPPPPSHLPINNEASSSNTTLIPSTSSSSSPINHNNLNSNHNLFLGNTNGGQVVLSQVIRPLGIPFG